MAVGYLRDGDEDPRGIEPRRPNFMVLGWRGNACVGGYSTAPDLLRFPRFARALRGNRLLPADLTEKITGGKVTLSPASSYGYGFQVHQIGGRDVRGHSGGPNSGINSDLEKFWDGSDTVIVLGNYDATAAQELNQRVCAFLAHQVGQSGG